MVVKRAGKEQEKKSEGNQHEMREELERLDKFKLRIAGNKLTLLIDEIRKSSDVREYITTSSSDKQVSIFGKDGVGGMTSDKLCVQIDNNKATVWIDANLYDILRIEFDKRLHENEGKGLDTVEIRERYAKEILSKPDELMEVPSVRNYAPILKALSNCGVSITGVTVVSNMEEIEDKLNFEHGVISQLSDTVKEYGLEKVTRALARYADNMIKTPIKTELGVEFRLKFEALQFEDELKNELYTMRKEVSRVLSTPKKKVRINGLDGIGVIDTDYIVVRIDKNEARVFMDDNAYFTLGREALKDTGVSPQEASSIIIKNAAVLHEELRHFPPILEALSESGIRISELTPKNADELKEMAELFTEQSWIASVYGRKDKPQEENLQGIVDAVKDPQKINDAFARYGITRRVEVKAVEVHKEEEIPAQPAAPAIISESHLEEEISKRLEAMKGKMVDEKLDAIEIVGFGSVKVINLHEDIIIDCRKGKASVIIEEDLLSSAMKYTKLDNEKELMTYLNILKEKQEFVEFVAAVKALNNARVEKFTITTYGHDADYYLDEARKTCAPAATFIESIASGKSIGETMKILAGSSTTSTLVESLDKTGFSKEAEEVSKYTEQVKITKTKFDKMIDEWVENKVPDKAELLKGANSLGMNQKEFETALESAVSEMKESNTHSERSVKYYHDRLDNELVDAIQEEFEGCINRGNQSIKENNARINKVEEALKVLRGS